MTFKFNIGTKEGKTYKLEVEAQGVIEKKLGDVIKGEDVSADLAGYELEITGASDKQGFPALAQVNSVGRTKLLLSYEKGMHKKPMREGKFEISNKNPKGLRLRKTVRGNIISDQMAQINLKVVKDGAKKLADIFAAPVEEKPAE